MYRCLMGSPCSAALSSGYAQTYYMSLRAWMRAMLVPSILGHKRGLCPRTAGPFKTGLSLIGHTSVALSRLRASQLIREAEQSRSLTSRSALNLSYSKQGISFWEKKKKKKKKAVFASPLPVDGGNRCRDSSTEWCTKQKINLWDILSFRQLSREHSVRIGDGERQNLNVLVRPGIGGGVSFMSPYAFCIRPCSYWCFERLICSWIIQREPFGSWIWNRWNHRLSP